jgi:hypothetical protein
VDTDVTKKMTMNEERLGLMLLGTELEEADVL